MSEFDLTAEIKENLNRYNKAVQDGVKKLIDDTTDELTSDLKTHSPRRKSSKYRGGKNGKRYAPGSYARSWKSKVETNKFSVYSKRVFNSPHSSLTHLLEKGHEARNGTRVAPVEHIAPLERKAVANYEKLIEKMIKSIK